MPAVTSVDRDRIQAAVREILAALGEDPGRAGLVDTPRRVAEMAAELFAGVGVDPATALGASYDASTLSDGAQPPSSVTVAASAPDARDATTASAPDAAPVLLRD
ncbi:MAG: GTP cyclohydrolase I, partial [Herbiconiux sp.]|nr:GTP cyclohydrolase I [Herbiconiux sp.]